MVGVVSGCEFREIIRNEGEIVLKTRLEKNYGDSLPERLQELRSLSHMSQAEIAQRLNISRQTYSHYETGRIQPPSDMLCQLADLFHVSVDTLLGHKVDISSSSYGIPLSDMDDYLEFITQSDNQSRYASLTEQEKRVLYYYCRLNKQNQRDILLFMRIKLHNEQ